MTSGAMSSAQYPIFCRRELESLGGVRKRLYPKVKRVLDSATAALLLVVLSPLIASVALVALVSQSRPVFFVQTRPGLSGKPFRLYKFRTMRPEVGGADVFDESVRITALGRAFRKLSLDELPQLWNVVRGDMSVVGPRPLLMGYLELYSLRQSTRHHVRPGLTGLAQVKGRNSLTWDDRLELDAQYVETFSLGLDLSIVLKSILVVFLGRGVSPDGAELMAEFRGSAAAPGTRAQGRPGG